MFKEYFEKRFQRKAMNILPILYNNFAWEIGPKRNGYYRLYLIHKGTGKRFLEEPLYSFNMRGLKQAIEKMILINDDLGEHKFIINYQRNVPAAVGYYASRQEMSEK